MVYSDDDYDIEYDYDNEYDDEYDDQEESVGNIFLLMFILFG